ncbi:MAG: DNA-directed RNA polymerase subunit G [Saccharolobus sp.]
MMESRAQENILECEVNSIQKGSLKNLLIVNLYCGNIGIDFDIIDHINIFHEKEKVNVILSKDKPRYTSEDFCAHGYVVTEIKDKMSPKHKTIISLFGLLVRIMSEKESILDLFKINIMDHIYFCVRKVK